MLVSVTAQSLPCSQKANIDSSSFRSDHDNVSLMIFSTCQDLLELSLIPNVNTFSAFSLEISSGTEKLDDNAIQSIALSTLIMYSWHTFVHKLAPHMKAILSKWPLNV